MTTPTWETETFKQIEQAATIGNTVEMMYFLEEGRFEHLGLTTKEAFRIYQDAVEDREEYERERHDEMLQQQADGTWEPWEYVEDHDAEIETPENPATDRQLDYIRNLLDRYDGWPIEDMPKNLKALSKSDASKLIDRLKGW